MPTFLKKLFQFTGRARRSEFWLFTLVWMVVILFAFLPAVRYVLAGTTPGSQQQLMAEVALGAAAIALLIPWLAVRVRRLHDVSMSGWWILILIIPFFGYMISLAMAMGDSYPGTNEHGPNPKRKAQPAANFAA